MSPPIFTLTQGDTASDLIATLLGRTGAAQDLSGATVKFNMRQKDTSVVLVDHRPVQIDFVAGGKVRYKWQAADVAVAGLYEGEFEATLADGTVLTFPTKPKILIEIVPQMA